MNKKINIALAVAFALVFTACENEKTGPVLSEITCQQITSPDAGTSIGITEESLDDLFEITWSAATYDVEIGGPTYTVEMDLESKDFSKPKVLGTISETSLEIPHSELNSVMTKFGIETAVATAVKIRVSSAIGGQLKQTSEVVSLSVTPWFEQEREADTVYLVGGATLADWNANNALPIINDGSSAIYTITTEFKVGGMKILKYQGAWAPQWGLDTGDETGGTLKLRPTEATPDPPEIPSPGVGTYRLDVNIEDLTYTFTAQ